MSDDAPTEADTDRDGFLSYPAEWHALTHGVYRGFTTKPYVHPPEPTNKIEDVEKEPHYYRGGYVIGSMLQLVTLGLTAAMSYLGVAGV